MIKAFVLGIPFYLGNPPPGKEGERKLKEERKRIMYRRNTALSQKWVYAPNKQTNNQPDVRRPTYLILIFERERERRCVKIWETAERKEAPALLEFITCALNWRKDACKVGTNPSPSMLLHAISPARIR